MLRVKTANSAIDVIGKIRRLIEIMLGFSAWLMSNMKNRMAALGHKQTFSSMLPQRLLSSVKQTLADFQAKRNWSLCPECPLSPIADIQIIQNQVNRGAAFGQKQTLRSGLAKMLLTLQPFKTTFYVIVLVVRIEHEQPLVKLDCC